ncbi:MAG TPA: 2'-5' RNA ligase family protein [Terriglobales bacterium]|nr:2'-5' RNA ligase family protein [Terriglobales bacterium]
MKQPLYALVTYVQDSVGQFVEDLRHQLHPDHAHLPAHITLMPPRPLAGSEADAIEMTSQVCSSVEPFEVGLGDVESFVPLTPTVFIRVAHAAYRMRELHDRLNTGALAFTEPWPYMPHLTIVKSDSEQTSRHDFHLARQRWAAYAGAKRVRVEQLTFVREGENRTWHDIAPIPLGRRLAPLMR